MVELDGIGSEQKGIRPCVVVSNKIACIYSPVSTIVPITSKDKRYMPTHYILNKSKYPCFNKDENTVLCEQIKTIDKQRIGNFIGKLELNDLLGIIDTINKNLSIDIM